MMILTKRADNFKICADVFEKRRRSSFYPLAIPLPRVGQPEGQHFLELEVTVIFLLQSHPVVEAGMQEELGR